MAVTRRAAAPSLAAAVACLVAGASLRGSPQASVSDADLVAASGTHTIAIGNTSTRAVTNLPLEVYVARVIVGEGEPNAPEATQQALAIAIRTYAMFNRGRHKHEGFDLCDATHCQVPRGASNEGSRRAAMATAGQVLTYRGELAEIFYSASCGGRSESAAAVWPNAAEHPYLRSVKDNVHDDDVPWTLTRSLSAVEAVMVRNGFTGRLKNVSVASRSKSGRAATLKLSGMKPERIPGDQFRLAIGAAELRSTSFSVKKKDDMLQFSGRGYGHGVGMCVIGAGRRARRGENATQILKAYYPGVDVRPLPF